MTLPFEMNRGIMQYRDGKRNTELLIAKRLLKRGEEVCPYTAALKASQYDSGMDGYRAGDYWLPSMHELAILMRDITTGTTKGDDVINTQLKKAGLGAISSPSNRWSSSRYGTLNAWSCYGVGITNYNGFYVGCRVAPVSAFKI